MSASGNPDTKQKMGAGRDPEAQVDSSGSSQVTYTDGQNGPRDIEKDAVDAPSQIPPADKAPDGGLQAWLVVLGSWCVIFSSFGWVNSVGVFQEYYQNTLLSNYSSSEVAWIPSLQVFFMMSGGMIFGPLYDRYGPRWLVFFGSFFHILGIMMVSLCHEYYQVFLAQAVCSGLGVAAIFIPAMSAVTGWFDTKRGTAFGIVATGSSAGGIIFPIMTSRLIRNAGFPWAMRACGFLLLGLLAIANLTIRSRTPPQPKVMSKAQLRKPFTEPDYLLIVASFVTMTFGMYVPVTFLPAQAVASGDIDENLIEYLIPIFNAASVVGRLSAGFIADKAGRFNVFTAMAYLSGIWILALWIPVSSGAGLISFAVLFGFSSGTYISLIAPLIMTVSSLAEMGLRQGLAFFIGSFAGLVTNPISGEIADGSGGWTGIKIYAGVFFLVGATFALMGRIRQGGWKLNAVV